MRHTKGQNVPGDTESGISNKEEFQKSFSSVGGRMSLEKFGFRPRLTSVDMNLSSIFRALSAGHKFSGVDDFVLQ